MKIEALTTFIIGRDRFEAGDVRTVSDESGAFYCDCGWAKDITGQTTTGTQADGSVDLAIQNATHSLGDSNG